MKTQHALEAQIASIRSKWTALEPDMDERRRRLWAGAEARALGHGGIEVVHRATGLARGTIATGVRNLAEGARLESVSSVRREGAGRKRLRDVDTSLLSDLDSLIEPTTRGDPMTLLRWTCKSVRGLATELKRMGHSISQE